MNQDFEIFLVAYERPAELAECIRRIYATTPSSFRLTIVVNDQTEETRQVINHIATADRDVNLIWNEVNQWCGGGSNQALELITAPYAIYLCSRECFVFNEGWAEAAVDFMESHPSVAMAGSLSHSPAYDTGANYPARIPTWPDFRKKEYAQSRADDALAHVQGGFYILRMAVAREVGFFNPAIYHNYMDVEYSYYLEACGHQIADLPFAEIKHINTWPNIEGYRPHIGIYHPLRLEQVADFEEQKQRQIERGRECPLCGWHGPSFAPFISDRYRRENAVCPQCGSLERHRALILNLRELDSLPGERVLDLAPVHAFRRLFEEAGFSYVSADLLPGRGMLSMDLCAAPFRDRSFDVIVCYHVLEHIKNDRLAIDELARMLADDGILYLQVPTHAFRRTTFEFDAPDTFNHDHVRDPGLDYYERLQGRGLDVEVLDLATAYPLDERAYYGIDKATGLTALVRKAKGVHS